MRDKFEEKMFQMAAEEKFIVPDSFADRVDNILDELPESKMFFHMNFKKAILLTAVSVMLLSVTVTAAVGALQQRMEEMNHQKIEEYYIQIQESKLGSDNYNRAMSKQEESRLQVLRNDYEQKALFPEGELTMIEKAEKYKGKGVAFLAQTSTFFFPEGEMSDEELLQLIDFRYKRDYSLLKMNEMIAGGEMEAPEISKEKAEASTEEILQSDAVYEPEQELTIPYTGELAISYIAAGQNCIFLADGNTVHTMEIGSSDSTPFFQAFGDKETRILSICQDKENTVYIGVWQWDKEEPDKKETSIWVIDENGALQNKISLQQYASADGYGILGQMTVDDEGYLYARFSGKASSDLGKDSILLVFDKEGNPVTQIWSKEYDSNRLGGLGIGKDGKVYTEIDTWDGENRKLGIVVVDREHSCFGETYFGIVPENTIMLDIVAAGADSDFVFWGYDGIFTYNLGNENAVNVLPAYEAPCQWEGVRRCALPDGRIVFGDGSNPEEFCFYYKTPIR